MPPARSSYHHGALREALLDTTLRLIEAEGIGAVSLRRVAREAGVSPGAPYHHFPDRAALLGALSARGYRLLAAELAEARRDAGSPVRALTSLIRAYVGFARSHPACFRLMFRPELSGSRKHPGTDPGLKAAEHAAERHLDEAVAGCVAAGIIPAGQADTLAIAAWSLAHGLASLWLDGQLRDDRDDNDSRDSRDGRDGRDGGGDGLDAIAAQVTALLESALTR